MGCDESTPVRTILRRRSVLDGWLVQDAVGATLQLPTSGARVRLVFVEAHGAFCVQRERSSCQCRFTVIELGGTLLPHLTAPAVSRYFQQHVEHLGIKVVLGDTAAALHGQGRVQEVETASGRRLPCDFVVVSIGVSPSTNFLEGSGIVLEDGFVVVDDLLRTNALNIFAAGDVTRFYDPVFARYRNIHHWENAIKQGERGPHEHSLTPATL